MKKKAGPPFALLGFTFVIIGFVMQDFTLSFTSGLFNLGLIFFLSGLVAIVMERRAAKAGED